MGTDGRWRLNRVKLRTVLFVYFLSFLSSFPFSCLSLNQEGVALMRFRGRIERDPFEALANWKEDDVNPCLWFGVECSHGNVVILNLRNLCLRGTLAPEIRELKHLKSLILRNNSFSGDIPKELAELQALDVLDLAYNNLSGLFPSEFETKSTLTSLLLNNGEFLARTLPECSERRDLYESKVEESGVSNSAVQASCNSRSAPRKNARPQNIPCRRLLQELNDTFQTGLHASPPSPQSPSVFSRSISPPPPPAPTGTGHGSAFPAGEAAESPNSLDPSPPPKSRSNPTPPPFTDQSTPNSTDNKEKNQSAFVLAGVLGGGFLILVTAISIIYFRNKKVSIKPWATGISSQLQKAFVAGVQKLKLSDLQVACEDFSNIIGSSSDGMIYKGTLSSGAEIAVTSPAIKSHDDWSGNLETRFRGKIDRLSKVNHKNFLNLIGYCQEDEPFFARMMVFEYAPNGTLFEHLHTQEAEHLKWGTRLRVAMGIAYCLDHMHQLTPPVSLKNLQSSSVYLTEDNAAKVASFSFLNDASLSKEGSSSRELLEDPTSDVFNFGIILYEIVTGKVPNSEENDYLEDSLSPYIRREKPVRQIVDPTLRSFQEDVLEKLLEVIQDCVHPEPNQRPAMREVACNLRDITGIAPDAAVPRLSPAWWAELEILSTEGN